MHPLKCRSTLTRTFKRSAASFLYLFLFIYFVIPPALALEDLIQAEPKYESQQLLALAKHLGSLPPVSMKTHLEEKSKKLEENSDKKQLWNLRSADLRSVITAVSQETSKNFLIDPRVQGKITLISSTPIARKDIYPLFISALNMAGFSAIPSGDLVKIIPNNDAIFQAPPMTNGHQPGTGDEIVIRIWALENANAQQLIPVLRPLLAQNGQINAYIPTNTLVMVGQAEALSRIIEVAKGVDVPDREGTNMIYLRYAQAEEVVKTVKALEQGSSSTGVPRFTMVPDDRSNAVLINANKGTRLRLRALIAELDKPSPQGESESTQIIYLRYLQAKDILPVLVGVVKSQYKGPVESMMGTQSMVQIDKDKPGSFAAPANSIANNMAAATPFSNSGSGLGSAGPLHTIQIIGEPNNNAIIIHGPPNITRSLKRTIEKLDVRPTQVMIEAIITELDDDAELSLGIEWGTTPKNGQSQTPPSPLIANANGFTEGFGVIRPKNISTLRAQLSALTQAKKNHILSTPSILVLDNHNASIKVGNQVSIATTNYPNNANGGTPASPYNTFDRTDVALELNVTPQISKRDKTIKLNIVQKNNELAPGSTNSSTPTFNIK